MTQGSPWGSLFSDREMATTLAALRHWQRAVPEKDARSYSPLHFKSVQPLSKLEIDAIREKLNRIDPPVRRRPSPDPRDLVAVGRSVGCQQTMEQRGD